MDPFTASLLIGGGSALASGGLQYLNSKEALKRQAAERAKIEELVNSLQDPNFDFSTFTPEQFQVVAQYNPELAQFIAEKNPTLVEGKSADAIAARNAQMSVLRDMIAASKNGEDPIYALQRNKAMRNALASTNRFNQDIEQDMSRRGLTDSALGQALKAQANAANMQTAALEGEQAAANAYQNRLNQSAQAAGLASNIRGQELSQEELNARAINDFNQRMAGRQQNYANQRADLLNNMRKYNLEMAQDAANKNVVNRNNAQMWNTENRNKLAQQKFANDLSKVGLRTGAAQSNIQGIGDAVKTQNQAYQSLGDAGVKIGTYYGSNKKKKPDYYDYDEE